MNEQNEKEGGDWGSKEDGGWADKGGAGGQGYPEKGA